MKPTEGFAKNRLYVPLLFTLFLILLAIRRWQVLVSPQVWDEDRLILAGIIKDGWPVLFDNVAAGYLILVPKIISAISLMVSFLYYPIVSTIVTWLFIALVGLAISLAPTHIRGKVLCAIAVFLVPSDPEVFGLPLYTFWWASILLLLLALWDEKRPSLNLRLVFLLAGGLSSPVIVLIMPVLYFRAYWYRSLRSEQFVALIATPIAAIQIYFILKGSAAYSLHVPPLESVLMNFIPAFFGRFTIGNWSDSALWLWPAGIVLTGVISTMFIRDRRNVPMWILLYLLVGSIALTVTRVDPILIHPRLAGPRYFFLPFLLMFWTLIQYFYVAHSNWIRSIVGIAIAAAVINAGPVLARSHDDLHWANHVLSCRLFPEYYIPVHFDGNRVKTYFLNLSGKNCADLLRRDIFVSSRDNDSRTFAYTVIFRKKVRDGERENSLLISSTMLGADREKSKFEGYRVIGSYNTSDADTGEVLLKLRRGDRLRYRSGTAKSGRQTLNIVGHEQTFIPELPIAADWETIEFSNSNLPAEFVVRISDEGQRLGEWVAIRVRN